MQVKPHHMEIDMVFLFNNNYCYTLSFCTDEEFKTLNFIKRIRYNYNLKRVLKSFKYDKTAKMICDEESIHQCIRLASYMRNPVIIDMDGVSYLSSSEYWEEHYGLPTK